MVTKIDLRKVLSVIEINQIKQKSKRASRKKQQRTKKDRTAKRNNDVVD